MGYVPICSPRSSQPVDAGLRASFYPGGLCKTLPGIRPEPCPTHVYERIRAELCVLALKTTKSARGRPKPDKWFGVPGSTRRPFTESAIRIFLSIEGEFLPSRHRRWRRSLATLRPSWRLELRKPSPAFLLCEGRNPETKLAWTIPRPSPSLEGESRSSRAGYEIRIIISTDSLWERTFPGNL